MNQTMIVKIILICFCFSGQHVFQGMFRVHLQFNEKIKHDSPGPGVPGDDRGGVPGAEQGPSYCRWQAARGPCSDVVGPQLVKAQKAPPKICRKTLVDKVTNLATSR